MVASSGVICYRKKASKHGMGLIINDLDRREATCLLCVQGGKSSRRSSVYCAYADGNWKHFSSSLITRKMDDGSEARVELGRRRLLQGQGSRARQGSSI